MIEYYCTIWTLIHPFKKFIYHKLIIIIIIQLFFNYLKLKKICWTYVHVDIKLSTHSFPRKKSHILKDT